MPVSFATLQIFDQYLTTYRSRDGDNNSNTNKRSSRFYTHNQVELKDVYNSIQWKNRFAPIYLSEPTPQSIAYAIHLKESAQNLKQTINSLSGDDDDTLFSMKTAYSDNEALASVDYVPEDSDNDAPNDFDLQVKSFASPQVNTGSFIRADQPIRLKPDTYSFDILTNKLHYELQFTVNEGDTNSMLQNKLARLINHSDIGVSAKVLENNKSGPNKRTALEITSDAYGLPYQGERHFTITDEKTSYSKGIVDYLGLNKSIKDATNAVYTINGNDEESSYSNMINVYGAYHVTLHPENAAAYNGTAKIGLNPDSESLSYNIETFVEGYNQFLKGVLTDISEDEETINPTSPLTKLLAKDLKKFLRLHKKDLEKYGISINDDATLEYTKIEKMVDPSALQGFGNHVLRKLNAISLDPMEYVDRRICTYPNPFTTYINPYMTSIYTGMLFSTWT